MEQERKNGKYDSVMYGFIHPFSISRSIVISISRVINLMINQLAAIFPTIYSYSGLAVSYVSAQAKCTVNGREVPCEEALQTIKTAAGLGIGIFLVILVVIILAAIFWLMMLIHAIRNPIKSKAVWMLLLLLTGIIGAIVYYFAVKRKLNKVVAPVSPIPPAPPPVAA